jgi:hypothetical protein
MSKCCLFNIMELYNTQGYSHVFISKTVCRTVEKIKNIL